MIIEISNLDQPELRPYASLAKGQIPGEELLIAESPKVIERALDAGLQPVSLLCEKKHLEGDAAAIISGIGNIPVYTGARQLLAQLTGYTLTRGVLCAFRRPQQQDVVNLIGRARRLCVMYDVCDSTNVGVIFRTAAALGYDVVLMSAQSCDPFNRRAIRVSMGAVFQIPWVFVSDVMSQLEAGGFRSVSMALKESVFLQDFSVDTKAKYAVIMGSEGYGLPDEIIEASTHVVKIPMYHGVDSLNVGAAAAIALWHFR